MLKLLFALLNAAKLGPILKTGGTMLISVGAYALIFGIWYAVGFVLGVDPFSWTGSYLNWTSHGT